MQNILQLTEIHTRIYSHIIHHITYYICIELHINRVAYIYVYKPGIFFNMFNFQLSLYILNLYTSNLFHPIVIYNFTYIIEQYNIENIL